MVFSAGCEDSKILRDSKRGGLKYLIHTILKFAIVLENSIAMLTVCLWDPANLCSWHEDKDIISCEHVAHVSTQTSSLDCDVQQQINLVSTVQPSSVPEGSDLSKSNDELFQAQRQDPILKHLFSLKEKYKDEPPKWQEISHLSPWFNGRELKLLMEFYTGM